MYNKLFTKILDSSVWLECHATRIVWITLLASMDEDGYAHFSALDNLSRRAGVTLTEAQAAIECFLNPDPNSGDTDNDGRRIEKVPGGYMILNALKYRNIYNRIRDREQTKERVRRFRQKRNGVKRSVTVKPNAEAYSEADANAEAKKEKIEEPTPPVVPEAPVQASLPMEVITPPPRSMLPFKRKGFQAPTLKEAIRHAQMLNPPLPESEVMAFIDFYDSKGWKVGSVPMVNWRSAMSGWRHRWLKSGGRPPGSNPIVDRDLKSLEKSIEKL